MGQPGGRNRPPSADEYIVRRSHTRGSETSQYPEEKKSNEIARVVASENAQSPNRSACTPGLRDPDTARDGIGERIGKSGHSG